MKTDTHDLPEREYKKPINMPNEVRRIMHGQSEM
jgi:hypothetical protein